ncbi:MAG: hypothetical protein IAF58_18455 [Leptolyngbya sp.]|nr:hypothetical protein [Candidatus Melainabacteria bacterium]
MRQFLAVLLAFFILIGAASSSIAKEKKQKVTPPIKTELKFDGESWRNQVDRSKMVNSLIKSKLLIGKTQKEVEELLGSADHLETNLKTFTILTFHLNNTHFESGRGQNIVSQLSVTFRFGKVTKLELSEHKSHAFTKDGPSLGDKYKND